MRKLVYVILTTMAVALVGCVTINVYFPEAAAQKAADQFIGNVLDQARPATKPAPKQPAPAPKDSGSQPAAMLLDLLIPAAQAADAPDIRIQTSATMRDAAKVPLSQRAQANAAVADENRDRAALYREIAVANNHPEWESQIRATFAKGWIEKARAGWYYQNAAGAWQKK